MNNPDGLGGKSGKKADIDNVANGDVSKDTRKRSNHAPERVIARLKRDKADADLPEDVRQQASVMLAGISSGEIKPYKAAKAMGYVKAPDPAAIVHKQREKASFLLAATHQRVHGLSIRLHSVILTVSNNR
ncbi:hypothetical protein [Thiorhodococcus minor]|uniref:Uncharacterized protein n=1 Tax=Thiorhodococcus minor TaxID=57489 RepID=A0A6M0JVV0_9GAMM|nr:hypothetical protein [Thiorhodococcus minor]NEV61662.1 hypothetical protein [Thiorhodococcus minor]